MKPAKQLLMCGKPCVSCGDEYQAWMPNDVPETAFCYSVSCSSCGLTMFFRKDIVDDPVPVKGRW